MMSKLPTLFASAAILGGVAAATMVLAEEAVLSPAGVNNPGHFLHLLGALIMLGQA